jgi:hypothetical protein
MPDWSVGSAAGGTDAYEIKVSPPVDCPRLRSEYDVKTILFLLLGNLVYVQPRQARKRLPV